MKQKDSKSLYDKYVVGRESELRQAAIKGADNRILAKILDVGHATFYKILKESPKLKELLYEAKLQADNEVEAALYRRAIGYESTETITEVKMDGGSGTPTSYRKVQRPVPPDVTAAIFWLKNRQPERWRDRVDLEGSINASVSSQELTEEELMAKIAKYRKINEGQLD